MVKKILICLVCFFVYQVAYGQKPIKIIVFPFQISSLENLNHLSGEIWDTLITHLDECEKASVVERALVESALEGRSIDSIDEALVRRVAEWTGADFAVWGSLTKIGKAISIDVELLEMKGGKSPQKIYVEDKGLDRLTPLVSELAQHIISKFLDKEIIAKIYVKGNLRIEEDTIKSQMKTQEGDVFSKKALREDLKRIYRMDYFEDVHVDKVKTSDGYNITFIVSERPFVKKIEISGNRLIEKDDIMDVLDIKIKTILNFNRIKRSVKNILRLYKEEGYWAADVEYKVYYLKTKEAVVDFIIEEKKKTLIKEIKFSRNKAFDDEELRDVMKTKQKGFFWYFTDSGLMNEEVLDQDSDRISALYSENGYINIKVGKPEIIHDEEWIYVTIPIDEGKQFKIGEIKIKGDLIEEEEILLKGLKTIPGGIFNRKLLRGDINHLTDLYAKTGYAFIDVRPLTSIDEENQVVHLTFDIKKGKKAYFEKIIITGNTRTRDKVIRREMKVVEGDLYNKNKLSNSYKKLYRLGYFEEIDLNTERGSLDDKLNLNIKVKERPTGAVSAGFGYSSIDHLFGMLQVSESNLFGRGQKLSFVAKLGGSSHTYNLGFTEPWFLDTRVSAGFDIYDASREYTDYTKEVQGGDIRFGFPTPGEYTRLYLTYRYEDVFITDVSDSASEVIRDEEGTSVTSSITTTLLRDSRDSTIFPSKGSKNSISIEYAGGVLGGTNYFTKYIGSTTWYFPLFWDTVFMTRSVIGYVHGNEGRDVPLFERFFLGGIYTIRGFETYSIGPTDPETGDVIGGDKELIFNVEYIFPLVKDAGINGVIFFDAGNAFDDDEDFDLRDLRRSVGAGIRWYSPMGPLRLEWGYNLKPKPDEKQSNWDFSIGLMF
ncbi:MAG: outer membrane protein assembly factor BamA [Thermodesulfobacteriota bacterium]|nr:outer membrane protein assembly factor BamA [Thermodesulfobacteriota bacterium]